MIKLIQAGALYIYGRDRHYRPIIVTDLPRIIAMAASDPEVVSTESMQASFIFVWNYLKRVMFLPGHVDHWNSIMNMGFASMWAIPRQQVSAILQIAQSHMMYMLYKGFYLNTSWGQTLAYKAISVLMDPVTKAKLNLSSDNTHPELLNLVHPSQLEERFGGTGKTPTNFWPPFVGATLLREEWKAEEAGHYVADSEYPALLKENPIMDPHPDFITPDTAHRDFYVEPSQEQSPAPIN